MARNPFEQLQDVAVEPRQAFEDIVASILKCVYPDSRRVRIFRGDGGIDVFTGTLGADGTADVYQAKYFPSAWGDSQKQQIRDAYKTASESPDYRLGKWTLCVPTRLTKEDLRWFDEWRGKQSHAIELLDGDDLTKLLDDNRCGLPLRQLRASGVIGLKEVGPELSATAFVHKEKPSQGGLTAIIILQLRNDGGRTARGITTKVTHAETGCLSYEAYPDWEQPRSNPCLNPRMLRYRQSLNPAETAPVMQIPLCERSVIPFAISIIVTAEDCEPRTLRCELTSHQIEEGQPVAFQTTSPHGEVQAPETKLNPPTSEIAKELLQMILAHPSREERGLTEIADSPNGVLEVCFIPNTTQRGAARSVKKSLVQPAIAELLRLGWLLPPEQDGRLSIYELNPEAN